jgi:hypothetical protein
MRSLYRILGISVFCLSLAGPALADCVVEANGTTILAPETRPEGTVIYNTDYDVFQGCEGDQWVRVKADDTGSEDICGDSNSGFFILSQGGWTGDLVGAAGGGMTAREAATALCVTDLNNYNWRCKQRAQARQLLDDTHVQGFICDSTGCNGTVPDTIYYYAYSNHDEMGGNKFKTDGAGLGPNDTYGWSSSYALGDDEGVWTGRGSGTNSVWGNGAVAHTCNEWTDATGSYDGRRGNTGNSDDTRWAAGNSVCTNTFRLLCVVNP